MLTMIQEHCGQGGSHPPASRRTCRTCRTTRTCRSARTCRTTRTCRSGRPAGRGDGLVTRYQRCLAFDCAAQRGDVSRGWWRGAESLDAPAGSEQYRQCRRRSYEQRSPGRPGWHRAGNHPVVGHYRTPAILHMSGTFNIRRTRCPVRTGTNVAACAWPSPTEATACHPGLNR